MVASSTLQTRLKCSLLILALSISNTVKATSYQISNTDEVNAVPVGGQWDFSCPHIRTSGDHYGFYNGSPKNISAEKTFHSKTHQDQPKKAPSVLVKWLHNGRPLISIKDGDIILANGPERTQLLDSSKNVIGQYHVVSATVGRYRAYYDTVVGDFSLHISSAGVEDSGLWECHVIKKYRNPQHQKHHHHKRPKNKSKRAERLLKRNLTDKSHISKNMKNEHTSTHHMKRIRENWTKKTGKIRGHKKKLKTSKKHHGKFNRRRSGRTVKKNFKYLDVFHTDSSRTDTRQHNTWQAILLADSATQQADAKRFYEISYAPVQPAPLQEKRAVQDLGTEDKSNRHSSLPYVISATGGSRTVCRNVVVILTMLFLTSFTELF